MCWFRLCSQDVAGGERWVCCVWQFCAPASLAEAVRGWLGLGVFLLLELLGCSPAAHVLTCCCVLLPWQSWCAVVTCCCGTCGSCMVLSCSSCAAEGPWQQWLGLGEQSKGTPSPSSPGWGWFLGSPKLQLLYSTPSKSKGVAHGARPICLFPFPPVAGGQDGGCHTIL